LHYRGFSDVAERWEWHSDLVAATDALEVIFEQDLGALVAPKLPAAPVPPAEVAAALAELVRDDDSPSMSKHLARHGTRVQYAEFLAHRSIYHLKEADPHTWGIPRMTGGAKAALMEIQSDEYGGGRPDWMHSALFATSMRGVGLDDRYGHYLNEVPAITLAWANTMTFFGLHRRLRGAIAGHLAALEMTSSLPNRRYGNGLRRLGFDADTTRFFDEHVEADAVHEQIAAHDLAGKLAISEPRLNSSRIIRRTSSAWLSCLQKTTVFGTSLRPGKISVQTLSRKVRITVRIWSSETTARSSFEAS